MKFKIKYKKLFRDPGIQYNKIFVFGLNIFFSNEIPEDKIQFKNQIHDKKIWNLNI